MPISKPPRRKNRKNNPATVKKELQGLLLFEKATNKYKAFDESTLLISKLTKLFERKGNKLTLSNKGDEIYYFNEFLENAINILEKA